MIIKNKQTKKEYPCTKVQWDNFPQKVKDLFSVIDSSEQKEVAGQPIKNVVEPKQKKEIERPTIPATGNKENMSKNNKHKKQ